MKLKISIYSLITLLAVLSTIILYTLNGLDPILQNKKILIQLISTITALLISNLLITLFTISTRVIHKKNILRINLLLLATLIIISLTQKIPQIIATKTFDITIIQPILFTTLLIITIALLKNLKNLTEKLFTK